MPNIYEQWSTDAGSTWGTEIFVTTGSRPSLTQTNDGVWFCCYESTGTVYVRESLDRGATWSAAFGSVTGERPFMWVDPKRVRLHRIYQTGGNILHQSSSDAGATWSSAHTVVAEATDVYPEGTCLPDGRPQVIYRKSGTFYQYRSNYIDGSGTWSAV